MIAWFDRDGSAVVSANAEVVGCLGKFHWLLFPLLSSAFSSLFCALLRVASHHGMVAVLLLAFQVLLKHVNRPTMRGSPVGLLIFPFLAQTDIPYFGSVVSVLEQGSVPG